MLDMAKPNVTPLFVSSIGVFNVAYPPTLYHTGRPDNSCTGRALCVNGPCFERNVRKAWICKKSRMLELLDITKQINEIQK